jgi:hypothetical protein
VERTVLSARGLRPQLAELLGQDDVARMLKELRRLPNLPVINALFSFLYSTDPEIKWHGVTAMGTTLSFLADEDIESARNVIRRFMWNLNDESGGIGWGSAEAMGESLESHKGLADEYSHMLLSYARSDGNFQEDPIMQRGVLWGIGRLAQERPSLVEPYTDLIVPFLESGDASVLGHAVWVLNKLDRNRFRKRIDIFKHDDREIQIYAHRRLHTYRIRDLSH